MFYNMTFKFRYKSSNFYLTKLTIREIFPQSENFYKSLTKSAIYMLQFKRFAVTLHFANA